MADSSENANEPSGFLKREECSWLGKQLLAFQGLCPVE